MNKFLWIPGDGYNPDALERLKKNFSRPSEPMGEAWFMSVKRHMYDNLLGDIDTITFSELKNPLNDIPSGLSAFGFHQEWYDWYHYLLPQLIPRNHEHYGSEYLLEYLITGFIAVYPEGIKDEPYIGFQEDVLNTLGKCIMDKECWSNDDIILGKILCPSNNNPARIWGWYQTSGDLSASLFFCMKYLPAEQIPTWFESALNIKSPHWRAQMLVWMTGAYEVFTNSVTQPSQFISHQNIDWAWSHCLKGDYTGKKDYVEKIFISEENKLATVQTIENYFNDTVLLEWLVSISQYDYLENEIGNIAENFKSLYLFKKETHK